MPHVTISADGPIGVKRAVLDRQLGFSNEDGATGSQTATASTAAVASSGNETLDVEVPYGQVTNCDRGTRCMASDGKQAGKPELDREARWVHAPHQRGEISLDRDR
jgi:hypothetical protein